VQVPGVAEQLEQTPVQADSQQTPSAQKPVAHSSGAAQGCPGFFAHTPAPSQVIAPAQESGSSAPETFAHTPVWAEQAWQLPLQAASQQTPSAQKPEAHSPPAAQPWPSFERHAPASLQVRVPVHSPGSSAPVMEVQVPGVAAQVWQGDAQAEPQQTPSTHCPLRHSAPSPHGWPLFSRQAPTPSQLLVPEQVPGSSAPLTAEQVP
jgi:hypothetical protein